MSELTETKREKVAPRAAVLIESMRDIGYSLKTAVADVIDNSITAGAGKIELLADTDSDAPAMGILDDGTGMSKDELLEAMRPGTKSPLVERKEHDLGRFGLGLKTASFSQCRRLTVLTKKKGDVSCARWDLDLVAATDEWFIEWLPKTEEIRWAEKLQGGGTLVIWQKLDRLIDQNNTADRSNLVREIDETATHLELVFHRFLSGETGLKRVTMSLNERPLVPFDPFNSRHAATIHGPEEIFKLGNREIRIQPFTLPHHEKVTAKEWERYAGPEGYIKNQGFYVYREKRLIIHGTWFNLSRQTELAKLSRVRIDMPNGLDADWKIDVRKASALPPAPVRNRLRRIIEEFGSGSRRAYMTRGKRLASDNRLPVWVRSQDKNRIYHGVNAEHPAFRSFRERLSEEQKHEFMKLLVLVGAALPINTLFSDVSSNPEKVAAQPLDEHAFASLVKTTYRTLKSGGTTDEDIRLMMSSAEPFRSHWDSAKNLIDTLEQE